MRIVGLTGGIGSGKTTVANFFKQLGVPVYIADDAGKRLLVASKKVRTEVISLLGETAYNGEEPDRKYIASQVFASKEKLDNLNKIIHPAVQQDFDFWLQGQSYPYIIYEAAILFETGGYKKCDSIILVTAPLQERLLRVQKRDSGSIEEIEARMANQWTDEQKRKLADFEIKNEDLKFTEQQVRNLHEFFLKAIKK